MSREALFKYHQQRQQDVALARQFVPIIAALHGKLLCDQGNLPPEVGNRVAHQLSELYAEAPRKELFQFLEDEQKIFGDLAEQLNPGAQESDLAYGIRRQYLIAGVFHDTPGDPPGELVVKAVDLYLLAEDLGLTNNFFDH